MEWITFERFKKMFDYNQDYSAYVAAKRQLHPYGGL